MKKITYIIVSLLFMAGYSYGQGEIEANQFSRGDLNGTARSVSMGGAFGALGGDLSGVAINPAGIAVYRSSEIAGTVVFSNENFKAGDVSNNKSNFNLNNLGFVGYFPTRNYNVPVVNFGFSYNKVKSFDREIGAFNGDRGTSLMDYMADISSRGTGVDPTSLQFDSNDDTVDPFKSGAPWLSVLGFNSYLINDHQDADGFYYTPLHVHDERVSNSLHLSERGSVDTYDFTVGTSINNVLNLGIALSLSDIYYNLYSQNSEDFSKDVNAGFDLRNWLTSEGNGVGVKLGLIYRPVNAFRLGLSYQSPTWYSMTDIYTAEIEHNLTDYVSKDDYPEYKKGFYPAGEDMKNYKNNYNFKTPDKWTVSAAAVLGSNMILSLDYEFSNFKNMKYSEPTNSYYPTDYFEPDNSYISSDYKLASTVRAGMEYRFTPQFSGRLGYAWMQNPYDTKFKSEQGDAMVSGSTTAYRLEGDANYITGGIGYRFNRNFYLDLAVVFKSQEDDLYSYPNVFLDDSRTELYIDAEPYKLTNNSFRGLLTIGYRF